MRVILISFLWGIKPRMPPTRTTVLEPVPIVEGFRLHAMCVFLTYPQCDVPMADLLAFLLSVVPDVHVEYAVVSSEAHQDGTLHRHALIKWAKKIDKKKAERLFDYNGYHPNQQKTRNIEASINYIKKDGDFVEHGECTWQLIDWFFDRNSCFYQ